MRGMEGIRTEVGRCKTTLKKWNILGEEDTINCKCGETQTRGHLIKCPLIGISFDKNDLDLARRQRRDFLGDRDLNDTKEEE